MSKRDTAPLPLGDLLRDLALLRASDIDFASILADTNTQSASAQDASSAANKEINESVARSQDFAKDARAALRVLNRGEVEKEGLKIDEVRAQLEDILQGLEGASVE